MEKSVEVTLATTEGESDALTVNPWVVTISNGPGNSILWKGQGCRIKIELDHPEHLSLNHSGYATTVRGTLAAEGVAPGTYHYGIGVLGKDKPHPDDKTKTVTDAYTIDPDYKVDR